jgi:hypothetical protein
MTEQDRVTRARLVDGKVHIEQPDGTWREAHDETDWDRVRTLSEEEILRMAEEGGTADMSDRLRLVRPYAFVD